MEKHIKVALTHKILSWLYAFFAIIFTIVFFIPSVNTPITTTLIFLLAPILMWGFFALHYFASKVALKQELWALNTSRGVAVFMLFGFPIGTVIGIYLLINCWHGWKYEVVN